MLVNSQDVCINGVYYDLCILEVYDDIHCNMMLIVYDDYGCQWVSMHQFKTFLKRDKGFKAWMDEYHLCANQQKRNVKVF